MALTQVSSGLLANTGVTTGTYGGATQHTVVSVNNEGQVTYAANVTPSIANTQITGLITASQIATVANTQITGLITVANTQITGTINSTQLTNSGVTAGTYGGTTQHTVVNINAQGQVTYAANATPSIANTQITGLITSGQIATVTNTQITGTINSSQLTNTAVTAGTYGGSTNIPVVTINAQGQVTSASNTALSPSAMTLISTKTVSTASSMEWTGLSGYNNYLILVMSLTRTALDSTFVQFGTGSTPTYITSGYYFVSAVPNSYNGTVEFKGGLNASGVNIFQNTDNGPSEWGSSGPIFLTNMVSTTSGDGRGINSNMIEASSDSGRCDAITTNGTITGISSAITAIRLIVYSGTLTGTASLYGIS